MALVQRSLFKVGPPDFPTGARLGGEKFSDARGTRAAGRADSERRAFLRLHSPKHTMVASSDASDDLRGRLWYYVDMDASGEVRVDPPQTCHL